MRGERSGMVYGLGDAVMVSLMEAAPVTGGLRFELAESGAGPARRHLPARPAKTKGKPEKRRFKPKKR